MAALDPIKEVLVVVEKEIEEIIAKLNEALARETVDPAEVAEIRDRLAAAAAKLNEKTPEA